MTRGLSVEVACFRRSYSKTQSSDSGGGEGGGGRVKSYAGKKKEKTRGDWGEKLSRSHLVFFLVKFSPAPYYLNA